ncbi:hypothetical protein IQ268_30670 [Oculatella sp. LEGE 06141]|uniref:hypothetical protein n=1 Tax=Oculatella sp. LEGE 06141 TaxID=1828648 RepID=UPI001881CDDE|nr:hypothetical protein [Oculatella sp. LEGE 06141]MBE9182903.1 hypothetical protein [Oculatella sp. LEGE 06141]
MSAQLRTIRTISGKTGSAIALSLVVFVLPACQGNPIEESIEEPVTGDASEPFAEEAGEPYEPDRVYEENSSEGNNAAVDADSEEPADYIGETVTVQGEIQEVYSPNTFQIRATERFAGEDLLIVSATPEGFGIVPAEGMPIQATGTVREFDLIEFAREYDLQLDADVNNPLEARYDGEAVVVTESAEVIDEEFVN